MRATAPCFLVLFLAKTTDSFSLRTRFPYALKRSVELQSTSAGAYGVLNPYQRSLAMPVKVGPHIRLGNRVVSFAGMTYALATIGIAIVVMPFMLILTALCELTGDGKRRRLLDWVVSFWAYWAMALTGSKPRVFGKENLPPPDETVVYVPNHTSYFDILVLSGFVPRPFKYLSKSEILDIPVVGLAMKLARHIFLKRNDLKSTVECADKCVERLEEGSSMVLFAEGTRSPDGRLQSFKKGAFQMAKTAGVRIVPVSIGHLHRWMPGSSPLPLSRIRHTYIKIHPPISTKDKGVRAIKNLCFEAVNSGLPPYQKFPDAAAPARAPFPSTAAAATPAALSTPSHTDSSSHTDVSSAASPPADAPIAPGAVEQPVLAQQVQEVFSSVEPGSNTLVQQ